MIGNCSSSSRKRGFLLPQRQNPSVGNPSHLVSRFQMVFILYIILGFFLGSIPFGLIVGKLWLGTDVRQQGSGNIGMTNVMR
ncbi:MAG: glycerol-3-phosphate acyltransferase, partial [SAR324 cluster bacterium]|nr:glycerol-3-phosphate acyltransferase [SAR324 cluster bacterium]